ncbi:MAG: BMC domain-containing protein [Myxococcales bacterium]|nr:BMC domain-containing protein [Myxococcales bacterium]
MHHDTQFLHQDNYETLAAVELVHVPAGFVALDGLSKEADVDVLFAGDIDPGRFLIVFCGHLGAVEVALRRSLDVAGTDVAESLLLPNAHVGLRAALQGVVARPDMARAAQLAMGVLQTHTVIGIVAAADRALKAADVALVRLRFATELGGSGHCAFVGDQDDVEAALAAGSAGTPSGVVVIARRIARPADSVYVAAAQRGVGPRGLRPLDP